MMFLIRISTVCHTSSSATIDISHLLKIQSQFLSGHWSLVMLDAQTDQSHRWAHLLDVWHSTAQMAMQQYVVEHGEHDMVQKKSWSSTASGLSSRCPDTVLPLDPARSGWESEVDSARLSLTIIQFTAHVILISNTHSQQAHICNHTKALWRWASGEAAGEETLEAVVADLHTGGLVLYGHFP